MAIKGLEFFYASVQRRFLEQVIRAFSGFQIRTGFKADGTPILQQVPVRMATTDKMIAAILQNGSENSAITTPCIVVYQTGLSGRRDALQNVNHVDTRRVTERAINPVTNTYTGSRGRSYTVKRLMPRPFEATYNVDIWTTNLDQKHQLSEQILTIMYPDIYIQNSDTALDWTAMTTMNVEEINWSSKSIGSGDSSQIDIMTITVKLPFWLSAPAAIKESVLIETVIANIFELEKDEDTGEKYAGALMDRDIITPGDHCIRVDNGRIQLLGPEANTLDPDGKEYGWPFLLSLYAKYSAAVSTLRLKTNDNLDDWDSDIVGSIQVDPTDPSYLIWTVDPMTLPKSTVKAVDLVIDPRKTWPGNGLPPAVPGQRYLLVHTIMNSTKAWGDLAANENDIIEYQSGMWGVAYRPPLGVQTPPQYVVNRHTGRQMRWTGYEWVMTFDGVYRPGMWRLRL